MITRYALLATLAGTLALGGMLYRERALRAGADAEIVALRASVAACSARMKFILEDKASDAEIDNLSDDDLRVVPDHWLR